MGNDNDPSAFDQIDPDLGESPNDRSIAGEGEADQSSLNAMANDNMVLEYEYPVQSDTLLYPLANEATQTWFDRYHSWFPILHQASFPEVSASTSPHLELVWKAMTAVVIMDQAEAPPWKKMIATQLRDQVMRQSFTMCSLQSVQALLILSNHFYAIGRFTEFWNSMSVCKR